MAATDKARFDRALKKAGLDLDARDKAAAFDVFTALERACALLKSEQAATDEPR